MAGVTKEQRAARKIGAETLADAPPVVSSPADVAQAFRDGWTARLPPIPDGMTWPAQCPPTWEECNTILLSFLALDRKYSMNELSVFSATKFFIGGRRRIPRQQWLQLGRIAKQWEQREAARARGEPIGYQPNLHSMPAAVVVPEATAEQLAQAAELEDESARVGKYNGGGDE